MSRLGNFKLRYTDISDEVTYDYSAFTDLVGRGGRFVSELLGSRGLVLWTSQCYGQVIYS